MRFRLLLLLPTYAFADARLELHGGGGAEAGTIMRDAKPVGVAELGVSAYYLPRGKQWGVGVMLEKVARGDDSVNVDIERELKLDIVFRIVSKNTRIRFAAGFGVRQLGVPGEGVSRPASTLRGLDLMRYVGEFELARLGLLAIDAYVSWTFGAYFGELYNRRSGDMPYTTRDYTGLTNTYVAGLSTSLTWH